jgi:hypothetical protein
VSPEQLRAVADKLRTLEEAVQWALARGFNVLDVITQDEYTHDVVIAAAPLFLVFDTT